MSAEQWTEFDQYRARLFGIAYRMLGSVMDAEDIVQEAALRWQRAPADEAQSRQAYLTTIVTRLCIDHLRSARVRREEYIGPWLPEPVITEAPPDADHAALSESLSMAFLVLLESLTPTERAVFLLREVFDYDYAEIARIVDKSEAACRQLVSRARQRVTGRPRRQPVTLEEGERLAQQFALTCATGDVPGLMNLLAPDVVSWQDGGGKALAARNPILGADRVARYYVGLTRKAPPGFQARLAWVNGQPGVVAFVDGQPFLALELDIADGRIQALRLVVNPDKLQSIAARAP